MTMAEFLENKGEVRGEARGREEGLQRVARNMLHKGMTPSVIAELTGLSEMQVVELEGRM